MTQKLSATARRDKASRDKAYAMTPGRRAKKTHAEREARANPSAAKGKDYDHKDQKWKTPKANRGNDGEGTKKEGNKHYNTK
jgi:hypothetical protein